MSESNHVGLWNRCLEIIRDNVPESTKYPASSSMNFWKINLWTCYERLYIKS